MSGGHFDYKQWHIQDIADEIESISKKIGKEKTRAEIMDSWRFNHIESIPEFLERYPEEAFHYPHLNNENIKDKFKFAVYVLRLGYIYAQRIDWLLSGDDGNESFIRRLDEEIKRNDDIHGI